MGKTYTATINAKAWKEHTCLNCGATFMYLLERKITGQAGSAAKAEQNAAKNAAKAIQTQVDQHPCPTCGLVQPDMVGQRRAKAHLTLFWLAFFALSVLIILRATYAVQANTLTVVSVVICAIIAGLHLKYDLANPNKDIEANRRIAEERVSTNILRHTPGQAVRPEDEHVNPSRAMLHNAALLLLIGSVVLVASPEILRARKHWPANADCYPPVVGAGDSTRIYLADTIHSVKGYWRGIPHAQLAPPSGSRILLTTISNQKDWGSTISAKSSEKNSKSTPWVEVTLPENPDLAGQTVDCAIDMIVEFPQTAGGSSFDVVDQTMHRNLPITLATPGAGTKYNTNWWQGTAIGMGLILISGQILRISARRLQKRANPTKIFVPQ